VIEKEHAMKLGEQFRSNVVTVAPAATVRDAVVKMQQENVGAVVVTDNRQVVGILTDRDVALALGARGVSPDAPVGEVMTQKVITIWEDQGVFNATQYFLGHQIRRLPVINRDGELVGMMTLDDMLSLLGRELFNVTRAVNPSLADHVA
jgi:CBS domain-containing protein